MRNCKIKRFTTLKNRFKKLSKQDAIQLLAIVVDESLSDTWESRDRKEGIKEAIEIWANCDLSELRY